MAHDAQYRDGGDIGIEVDRLDYPRTGERYWNCHTHGVEITDHDLGEKFLIIDDAQDSV